MAAPDAAQIAEAALADEHVTHGDRLSLQRRVLRLGKPPRRWRRPPWAAAAMSEPQEVCLIAKPLTSAIGATCIAAAAVLSPGGGTALPGGLNSDLSC